MGGLWQEGGLTFLKKANSEKPIITAGYRDKKESLR